MFYIYFLYIYIYFIYVFINSRNGTQTFLLQLTLIIHVFTALEYSLNMWYYDSGSLVLINIQIQQRFTVQLKFNKNMARNKHIKYTKQSWRPETKLGTKTDL